ncbi:hypothetical protein DOY81_013158, partial [Sarcophaga bullata]
ATEQKPMAILKKAAAVANGEFGMETEIVDAITEACDEVIEGCLGEEHFPTIIWSTITQINMNMNEVLSNRAIEIMGGEIGSKDPVHPNDHVNRGQSSNDTSPTACSIAMGMEIRDRLIPAFKEFHETLRKKEKEFGGIVKIGRTHLQDAVPISLGQEFSGYAQQMQNGFHV